MFKAARAKQYGSAWAENRQPIRTSQERGGSTTGRLRGIMLQRRQLKNEPHAPWTSFIIISKYHCIQYLFVRTCNGAAARSTNPLSQGHSALSLKYQAFKQITEPPAVPKMRKSHKKTRTGCTNCRRRRVKVGQSSHYPAQRV